MHGRRAVHSHMPFLYMSHWSCYSLHLVSHHGEGQQRTEFCRLSEVAQIPPKISNISNLEVLRHQGSHDAWPEGGPLPLAFVEMNCCHMIVYSHPWSLSLELLSLLT